MKRDRASTLADGSAGFRAAGARDPSPTRRNPDHLAYQLTSPMFRFVVRTPGLRQLARAWYDFNLHGIYAAHQARTHLFDERLLAGLERGVRQVALLGAGMDSRAYRFHDRLDGVVFVEADHPATQAVKRQRLAAAGIGADHVTFVPTDFESPDWEDALAAALDTDLPTLFLWEGVTAYLTDAAIRRTLDFVARFAPGTRVVFDYLGASFVEDPTRFSGGARHVRYAEQRGEPFLTGLPADGLDAWAEERGFRLDVHVDGVQMESRYRLADAGVHPVPSYTGIVDLEVLPRAAPPR